ncbi:hypothetical protein KDC22_11605 [Paenibacillus tritici]|uniref:hypothetical protein n=1 Tax=Paenibacillus tritici TaxID=1873425 RepID=UPI001BA8552D|nr:hypothetical protein [Paenibacillus tritici]QUL57056.1 hypothetical protein KDC22_11605 [Paenibacillus tritici]
MDEHLQLCALNNVNIEVIFFGEIEHLGTINQFNEKSVKFEDLYFIRENIKLRIAKKHLQRLEQWI